MKVTAPLARLLFQGDSGHVPTGTSQDNLECDRWVKQKDPL
jgi:hypothetical protein